MQEDRPQEQLESYQQGYQPVNSLEGSPYDTQVSLPVNNFDGPSSYSHQPYQPLNGLQGPAAYGPQALFPTPLPHNDARFVAALTYSLGWFSGLLFTLFTRENRYVRFHALQSLIFFGAINVLDVAFVFVGAGVHHFVHFIGPVLFLSFLLLNAIAFVGWLVAIVQAYRGTYYRLPLVGDIAARSFNVQPPLK
jgi:uncharacterized membrane protein